MRATDAAAVRRRALVLSAILVVVTAGYIGFFAVTGPVVSREEHFPPDVRASGTPLDAYVDVLAIDPIRQSMQVRIDFGTGARRGQAHFFGNATRDVRIRITDGATERDVRLERNKPLPFAAFAADIDGAIATYPFDRYAARTVISAYEPSRGQRVLPLRCTVWDGVAAWVVTATSAGHHGGDGAMELRFEIRRPGLLVFFACALYVVMILIAVSALTIATFIFVGMREGEAMWMGAFTAMVFALPALRNALPGGPPLGVFADIFVFLWAELAVAIALALSVIVWARRAPNA